MFVKGRKYRVMTLEELQNSDNIYLDSEGFWRCIDGGDCINDQMRQYLGTEFPNVFSCNMRKHNTRIIYGGWNFDYWMFKEINEHKTTRLLKAVCNVKTR